MHIKQKKNISKKKQKMMLCEICKKVAENFCGGGCETRQYCSQNCANIDWKRHKFDCIPIAADKREREEVLVLVSREGTEVLVNKEKATANSSTLLELSKDVDENVVNLLDIRETTISAIIPLLELDPTILDESVRVEDANAFRIFNEVIYRLFKERNLDFSIRIIYALNYLGVKMLDKTEFWDAFVESTGLHEFSTFFKFKDRYSRGEFQSEFLAPSITRAKFGIDQNFQELNDIAVDLNRNFGSAFPFENYKIGMIAVPQYNPDTILNLLYLSKDVFLKYLLPAVERMIEKHGKYTQHKINLIGIGLLHPNLWNIVRQYAINLAKKNSGINFDASENILFSIYGNIWIQTAQHGTEMNVTTATKTFALTSANLKRPEKTKTGVTRYTIEYIVVTAFKIHKNVAGMQSEIEHRAEKNKRMVETKQKKEAVLKENRSQKEAAWKLILDERGFTAWYVIQYYFDKRLSKEVWSIPLNEVTTENPEVLRILQETEKHLIGLLRSKNFNELYHFTQPYKFKEFINQYVEDNPEPKRMTVFRF